MEDNILTSLDNRRLTSFASANKPIKIIERGFNDPLTPNEVARFTYNNNVPKTYGEAIKIRINKQKPTSWPKNNPNGSFDLPILK